MAQDVMKTPLDEAKNAYDVALKAANDALAKSPVDLAAYNKAMHDLEEAEKSYAAIAANAMYDEYAMKDNPVIEIIKAYGFTTLRHKEEYSETDKTCVIAVNPIEKEKQIDLLAFCKRAKLNTAWQYTASKFNQLMCLRAAKQLGADTELIAKSYYMKDTVKQIKMGGTPTSNTQVCKLLQRVIDEILPNKGKNGDTIYKVNNHDVAYLDDLYGRKSSKQRLTVRVSNDSIFRRILVDIAYRLISNTKYGVDGFRVVKGAK